MKDIVIAGIQGSGKGTQAKKLLEKFGSQVKYFEAGNVLRALQSKSHQNAIGDYIWSVIDDGHYLSDEFMVGVFDLFLIGLTGETSCLVDGFPRQIGQMNGFIERMQKRGREFEMILLDLPEDKAIERLLHRRICRWCGEVYNTLLHGQQETCPVCGGELYQRKDEVKEEFIRNRFNEHYTKTGPVIEYFEKQWRVKHVNGDQSIDKVFEDILNIL